MNVKTYDPFKLRHNKLKYEDILLHKFSKSIEKKKFLESFSLHDIFEMFISWSFGKLRFLLKSKRIFKPVFGCVRIVELHFNSYERRK